MLEGCAFPTVLVTARSMFLFDKRVMRDDVLRNHYVMMQLREDYMEAGE